MKNKRNYGVLLPITCLPSDEGIGTLGAGAFNLIDFLSDCKASIWQVLPLNPTGFGDSPYQSCCSNALNYYLIDLACLVKDGLLTAEEVASADLGNSGRVDYGKQFNAKIPLLRTAFSRFNCSDKSFKSFVKKGEYSDFALFMSLKCRIGHRAWYEWDEPYRTYDERVAQSFVEENYGEFTFWQFTQYVFLKQWKALKSYANGKGVKIMGDVPLYIAYDSAEMWKYGDEIFKVDKRRQPSFVAGCPPDAFTEDGQLWGNPVYDWEKMKEDGYKWWNGRIDGALRLVDILRIDHFRGFDRYYEVPFGEKTARNGRWSDGPKEELFKDKLNYAIVAEDLGVLDEGVYRLMKNVGYPGMKILEFAFDGNPENEHKPTNYTKNFVCYTGTHDNMPLRGYIDELTESQLETYKEDLTLQAKALGVEADLSDSVALCKSVIRLAFASCANTAIVPLWDLLAMGEEARLNLPATVTCANWSLRFKPSDFSAELKEFLCEVSSKSGRAARKQKNSV
ncbi:MAG: 4-alpha-glucanotransferase [Candidatus Coproplasma sp.]